MSPAPDAMLDIPRPVAHIDLYDDAGSVEGYVVDGTAEEVPNWLQDYHKIVNDQAVERLKSYARLAILNNINVDEDQRGKGIGNQLMDDFMEAAATQGAAAIVLIADTSEEQMVGFDLVKWYQGYGFEAVLETHSGPLMIYEFDE